MKNPQPQSQIIIYTSKTGETKIDVRFENETVGLLKMLCELFQTTKNNISIHVKISLRKMS